MTINDVLRLTRCDHDIPLEWWCSQCADPITVDEEPWVPGCECACAYGHGHPFEIAEQRRRSGRIAALCLLAAIALVAVAWRLAR